MEFYQNFEKLVAACALFCLSFRLPRLVSGVATTISSCQKAESESDRHPPRRGLEPGRESTRRIPH
eukprot:scaffold131989_cov24-Tisochrysis_lutea.AAC.1